MLYVGIPNSAEKAALLERRPGERLEVPPTDLAFDCIRHLDFLRRVEKDDETAFPETLYWKTLLLRGRTEETALARCRRFSELHASVSKRGVDYALGRVAVTTEGMRLNGSHRAAIAAFLGLPSLEVDVHEWTGLPPRSQRRLQEEVTLKREGQLEWLGRSVADARTGEPLGRVAFVDVAERGRLRPGPTLALALLDGRGRLTLRPARRVVSA